MLNWTHLPKSFNPEGDGRDNFLNVFPLDNNGRSLWSFIDHDFEKAMIFDAELLELSGVKNIDDLTRNLGPRADESGREL